MGRYAKLTEPGGVKRWRICRRRLPQNQHETKYGFTDFQKRTIVIHEPLTALAFLRTLIHEAAHVAAPDYDEVPIERIEASVAAALLPFLAEISDELEE